MRDARSFGVAGFRTQSSLGHSCALITKLLVDVRNPVVSDTCAVASPPSAYLAAVAVPADPTLGSSKRP